MEFGVPKEVRELEMRVGLTPAGVLALVQAGHTVYVECDAGAGAGFGDEVYRRVGAQIVYSAAEAYGRADVVPKVTRPAAQEHALFRSEQVILSFFSLAVASSDLLEALVAQQITAIGYETIEEEAGFLPVLSPTSEVAGRLAPVIAGQLLMNSGGGRGVLLSGIPGVPSAAVVILGAGVLGYNAARAFVGLGAQVTVLDKDIKKLAQIDRDGILRGRVTTMLSNEYNIRRTVAFADVLVGCVLAPGRRTPLLVSREMVRQMTPGAVIIDFSIDQGGCIETSRPTTLRDQTYVAEGIIHHCVPNIGATVARTASHALTNAALPYLLALGDYGLPGVFRQEKALAKGVNLYRGQLVHPAVAAALGRQVDVVIGEIA